eukprot:2464727-Rhodomonas_salina.1
MSPYSCEYAPRNSPNQCQCAPGFINTRTGPGTPAKAYNSVFRSYIETAGSHVTTRLRIGRPITNL